MVRMLALAGCVCVAGVLCSGGCAANKPREQGAISGAAPAPSAELTRAAYERFKSLDGVWNTKSTKGWGGKISYQTIAGGTCVMQVDPSAHPGDTMVTMVHPDGDRLLLTHYCMAKNQPRLVATKISPDASQVTFEFLDGTNMASRDKGHMDKVVFIFKGDDEYTDQWTWYQDGQEKWMEEVVNVRVKKGT